MEVETSTLNTVSSGANAKPFTTHHNALDTNLYLRIAPELYLKRLLVGGFDKVFEIGRNYRNEGISTRHNPEFTMIESYQAYASFPKLIDQTILLLQAVYSGVESDLEELPDSVRDYFQAWQDKAPFVLYDEVQISMFDAVTTACEKADISIAWEAYHLVVTSWAGCDIGGVTINVKGLHHDLEQAQTVGSKLGVLFEYVAEPFLTEDYRTSDGKKSVPVFITEYPKELSPLARVSDSNPSVCDRFELFVDGRELANAFQELNDPTEQALRFKEQLESNDRDPMGFDADYIEALEYGMPPAIGFGMGVDRLVMLLTNAASIKDVILFPTLKPVK
jgi:lysyl-tRNA synthetase class 2